MTDTPPPENGSQVPPSIDTTVPHPARVWNYWLGGKDNYAADREAGDHVIETFPAIVDEAREGRAFLRRVVTHLASELGVRQFLDLGTGMPTHHNTHQVAQVIAPESHVVYVDNDPLVLAHANALLVGSEAGTTDYLHADLREPETIVGQARQRLDFSQPIGILLMGVLGHLTDDDAHPVARHLVEALPAGSYLALWDGIDTDPVNNEAMGSFNEDAPVPYRLRSPEQIAAFFDGLEIVEPGIVACPQWRPEPNDVGVARESNSRAGLGCKPTRSGHG